MFFKFHKKIQVKESVFTKESKKIDIEPVLLFLKFSESISCFNFLDISDKYSSIDQQHVKEDLITRYYLITTMP